MLNFARYLLDKTLSTLWAIFTIGSLSQLNYSLFLLLVYAVHIGGDPSRVLPFALAELSKVFFEGLFFFGRIFPAGARRIFPAKEIRENEVETLKIFLEFGFVKSGGIVAGGTALIIIRASLPNNWAYILSLVIAVPWGLARFINWLRQLTARYNKYEDLEDMSVVSQAINKIRTRLSGEEQTELALLAYQSHEMSRATAINLVKFLCGSLVVSMVISMIQELIARIPK